MFTNKYPGKCNSCTDPVAVGEGFAYKQGYRWLTVCASKACIRRLGLKEPEIEVISQKRSMNEDGEIRMAYDSAALPLLRAMPGAKWQPDKKCWAVSTKTGDLPRVLELAEQLNIEVPSSFKARAAAGTEDSRDAKRRAQTQGLYDFQREGVEFLALHDRAFLADDMGLGKTVQALVALPENAKAIVVCPASVKYNWKDELKKWRSDLKAVVCSGRNSFHLPGEGEVVIINYDILPSTLTKQIPEPWQTKLASTHLICDEAHLCKNYKTARSKKISALSRACQKVWFLSGTPLMNRPPDLFGVMCSGDMNVFGRWNKFVRLFNGLANRWGGYEWGTPTAEVPERLKRVMLRRLKIEVLKDLPPKTHKTITVAVDGKLKKNLDSLWDKTNWDETHEIGGLPSFEEFSAIRAKLAESRLAAALEIVESYEESETPLIVFSAHKKPVKEIGSRSGWACITGDTDTLERRNIVADFQAGKLKGVALTIIAGGVGLTLTRASHALFLDLDWTPANNIQAEDRICRIGQKSNNILYMLMQSDHPLDLHVHNLIVHKMRLIEAALEKSLSYDAPSDKDIEVPELVDESDEALAKRLSLIEEATKEAERQFFRNKVARVLERERVKSQIPEPELTPERKSLLEKALNSMLSVCDGAFTRDGLGFNKPDAGMAHWIGRTGLNKDDEVTYRVLERILSRYSRQLSGSYPGIWCPNEN